MSDPTFPRFQLGAQLRSLRQAAGVSMADAAKLMDCAEDTIRRIEQGKTGWRRPSLERLLDHYGVTDEALRETIFALAAQGKQTSWWARYTDVPQDYRKYIGLESAASECLNHEPTMITGLLQTEDYARAVVSGGDLSADDDVVRQRVELRMTRQERLFAADPLRLIAVLDEAAIRRVIGGDEVHRAQLGYLLEATQHRNITVQVLPFRAGAYAGMVGPFTVLRFPAGGAPSVVHAEGLEGDVYMQGTDGDPYTVAHESLRMAALSPADSCELITRVRDGAI